MANEELRKKRAAEDRRREAADLLFAYSHPGHVFEHEGWDVRWLGWRSHMAHIYEFGIWLATKTTDPGFIASTTLGSCKYYPNQTLELDLTHTLASRLFYHSDADRIEAMADAGRMLLSLIDTQEDR